MGQNGSLPKDSRVSNSFLNSGPFTSPIFWESSQNLKYTLLSNYREFNNIYKTPHTKEDLSFLLLGCEEQFSNIGQILETIIDSDRNQNVEQSNEKHEFIEQLCSKFNFYANSISNWREMNLFLYDFSGKVFSPWEFKGYPHLRGRNIPTFGMILSALRDSINIINKKEKVIENIVEVASYFNSIIPASSLPPPSNEFFENRKGNAIYIATRHTFSHGIASNGRFLFVLTSEGNLQIFPLFDMGALSIPLVVELSIKLTNQSSIIATNDKVMIYSMKNVYTYKLDDLFNKNIKAAPRVENLNKDQHYYAVLSDGLTKVFVEHNFTLHVYNAITDKKIRTIKLYKGHSTLSGAVPMLFPTVDYSLIQMFVNGSFFGIIFRIGPSKSILRVFSLITGEHIHDEQFQSNELIYACVNDMFNRCTWAVTLTEGSRLCIKKYYFAGSYDPILFNFKCGSLEFSKIKTDTAFNELANSLSKGLIHLIGAQIIPKSIITKEFKEINDLILIAIDLLNIEKLPKKTSLKIMLQDIVIILDANLKKLELTANRPEAIIQNIFNLIALLPANLGAFLFFDHIRFLTYNLSNFCISVMISLLDKLGSDVQIDWALKRIISSGILTKISLKNPNAFIDLFPDSINSPDLKPVFQTLLIVYQKCLATQIRFTLSNDPFLDIVLDDESSVLGKFGIYFDLIVSKFSTAVSEAKTVDELTGALIFELFNNFLTTLTKLTRYHTVARVATKLFIVLLMQMRDFLNRTGLDPSIESPLTDLIVTFLFLYCKFAATLVKGGNLTKFEENFTWLVKANVYSTNIENSFLLTFDDLEEKQKMFLEGKTEVMDFIYKKYKPPLNKNLKEDIKQFDRISILAFSKHLGVAEELLNYEKGASPSPTLRKGLDQMIRIRNHIRKQHQEGKEEDKEDILQRLMMLIRMGSDFEGLDNSSVLLGEFAMCTTKPIDIVKIVNQQRVRIDTTLTGFSHIDNTYEMNIHPLFNDLIAYALSRIENFKGLASILKMAKLSQQQLDQIGVFFRRILSIIQRDANSDRLILVAYRFFRDLTTLDSIQSYFLNGALEAFDQNPKRHSLFALCFSLIPVLKSLPESLIKFQDILPIKYLLLSESLKYVPCPEEVFDEFYAIFWGIKPSLSRLTCRTIYQMLQSKLIPDEKVESSINRMINFIGECYLTDRTLSFANELTWILRRMLVQNHRAKDIVMQQLLNCDHSNVENTTGVLIVIGSASEVIRPYCNIKYHQNRTHIIDCIALPQADNSKFCCYHRPFNISNSSFRLEDKPDLNIYAVPSITLDPEEFGHFDFIFSFFDDVFTKMPSVTLSAYMQVLALFSKLPEFTALFTPQQIVKLSECPLAFSDISNTLKEIDKFIKMPVLPECCGFGQIKYKYNGHISYISPQISPTAGKFIVNLRYSPGMMNAYVGIISSNVDNNHTRYSLVHIPSGKTFPVVSRQLYPFKPDLTNISIIVNMDSAVFQIANRVYPFPNGKAFKIIVAQKSNIPFNADIPQAATAFIPNSMPPQQQHGCIDFDNGMPLYTPPSWITNSNNFKANISQIPSTRKLEVNDLTIEDKIMSNFIFPPEYISIHIGFASDASAKLIKEQIRGLYKQLALQWSTIVLMRITITNQLLIKSERLMMKLFSLLTIQLESFDTSLFDTSKFPFSLEEPVWDRTSHINTLFMALEGECVNALRIFISRPEFKQALCNGLEAMCRSVRMHLIARPCKNHRFYPRMNVQIVTKCATQMIVAPNDFNGMVLNCFKFLPPYKPIEYLAPAIIPLSKDSRSITIKLNDRSISVFYISPNNNTWIYDTAFEMLLLLKNFVFIATTDQERSLAKKILLDCFIVQSPFIYSYLPQFADLIQVQIPTSPFDKDIAFRQKLTLAGSLIKNRNDYIAERFQLMYVHDHNVLTSADSKVLSKYFPEFFSTKIDQPLTDIIKIPEAIIDPGAIKSNFGAHILMIKQFSRQYKSLVGFPFWDILPMWFRVSGAFRGKGDYIDPKMSKTSTTSIHVSNPSLLKIEIRLTPKRRIGRETIVLISRNAEFDDPTFLPSNQIGRAVIPFTDPDMFFSIIGGPSDTWDSIIPTMRVLTKNNKGKASIETNEVEIESIKQRFIDDMTQFAVQWSSAETNELINILPRIALREPTFASVENIAKGSSLCSRFSPTVVALHALLIHHFNYIKYNYSNMVPLTLWHSMSAFVSAEDAADAIASTIAVGNDKVYPEFTIDRHAAHRIIMDGHGNPDLSIIHQLSRALSGPNSNKLFCRKRPWKVAFVGESAIDAGGPARELLTEAAASIFEPTSMLSIPVPNMRNHQGENRDVYIPLLMHFQRMIDYRTIGTLLGIIIRTGLSQDLPFAPLVWKYLANERITVDDITCLDKGLLDHFTHMREVSQEPDFTTKYAFNWTVEGWNGQTILLAGHSPDAVIDEGSVDQYIKEVTDFRISQIIEPLNEMKRGFYANTGFRHNPLLTGALLSRMAQGNGTITIQHLKQITVIYDFEGGMDNQYVKRFFRAAERLTTEQKKLLLKFITTLTRLPNSTINPDFKLKIDMLQTDNPDVMLPTSSTCFNRLHLPQYSDDEICYQKLLTAIQYCQTMENK